MAQVDPSIPLATNPSAMAGPDMRGMMSLADLAMKLKQNQQAEQAQNELRNVFSDPNSLDAQGQPTPDALRRVTAADPVFGMHVRQNMLQQEVQQLNLKSANTKLQLDLQDAAQTMVRDPSASAYEDAKRKGLSEDQAQAAGQRAYTEGLDTFSKSGLASEGLLNTIPKNFDYARVRTRADQYKQQQQDREDARLKEEKRHDIATETTQREAQKRADELARERETHDQIQEFHAMNQERVASGLQPLSYPPSLRKALGEAVPQAEATDKPISEVHGADYLKTLPASVSDQVKALADGRMAFPSGFALRSPYWQNMITRVAQYDPSFDAVNYNARAKTRADFTSGPSSKNITSINTTIGHLGTLAESADKLGNTPFDAYNSIANWVISRKGDPRVQQFNIAKNAVTDELTRVFRGTGGSEAEVQRWQETVGASNSPEQLQGAIKQGANLLRSRLEALGDTYSRGMGKTSDPFELLPPRSRAAFAKLEKIGEKTAKDSVSVTTPERPDAKPTWAPEGARQGKDGKWYVSDPARPGKYLMVQPPQ